MLQAILIFRILVVILAIIGIIANLLISRDIKINKKATKILNVNGALNRTAAIDLRGARASAGAHAMFLILGVISLGSPLPSNNIIPFFGFRVSRAFLSLDLLILWDAIQALVVLAQVRNQLDRVVYRRKK